MLQNPFSDKTRVLFFFVYNCWECGENRDHELHHITGRGSDSPYNAALVCRRCHDSQNGEYILSEASKKKFLTKTFMHLETLGYEETEADKKFVEDNKKYYV